MRRRWVSLLTLMGVCDAGWEGKWWWHAVNLGGVRQEGDPRGSLLLLAVLKLTALRQSPPRKDTAAPKNTFDWVSIRTRACVCVCILAGAFLFVCGGLHEDSLCTGVSLERLMSRADIPGQPGSGRSFIWAEMIWALRFGALTQEQCQPTLLLPPRLSFVSSFSVTFLLLFVFLQSCLLFRHLLAFNAIWGCKVHFEVKEKKDILKKGEVGLCHSAYSYLLCLKRHQ